METPHKARHNMHHASASSCRFTQPGFGGCGMRMRTFVISGTAIMFTLCGLLSAAPATGMMVEANAALIDHQVDRPFHEQEVTFSGAEDFQLRGTLTLPKRAKEDEETTFIGVLLLPGSGPTDRNGNQPPRLMTNLLRDVAHDLAKADVATLRFDKRACLVYHERWPRESLEALNEFFDWPHFLNDAAAAFRFLREHDRVDAERTIILGHSEGGLIALQVAQMLGEDDEASTAPPRGLILAGTAGRTLDHLLREQISRTAGRVVTDEAQLERIMADLERAMSAVKDDEPVPDDLHPMLGTLFSPAARNVIRAYLTVDPLPYARTYDGPVLVVNGQFDAQVSAEIDLKRLREALESRESSSVTARVIPAASHNFKIVESHDDPGFVGPVSPQLLAIVRQWIDATMTETESESE
ncbi:MAG: alpha/beta fold hydrolase [Phycisphaerales bacterium]|nr:MAG: alpha/beta fold hydrolase [Phycisphaerales bacterium]